MDTGIVEAIFIAPEAGRPMQRLGEAVAREGFGLDGDRYALRKGYWSGSDECQVTFIEAEELESVSGETGVRVMNGEHRRNIVTRTLFIFELRGCRFQIGGAVFEYERPRPTCDYIETVTEPGMTGALAGERGGICARVLTSGKVKVGDRIFPITE
jgi:MOSC domain-containing protein YiiM